MNRLACLLACSFTLTVSTTSGFAQVGGVYIDADGLLRESATLEPSERLRILKSEAADSNVPGDLRTSVPLRKVSLRRLESAVQELHAAGNPLPAEMHYLAGLNRIQHVFFYPETSDVVLAGPAEPWIQLPTGEVVGTTSRRSVLHLEDLIVALRAALAPEPTSSFVGCSIEPTADGTRRYATYMNGLRMDRSRLPQIFGGMEQAMGPQDVKLHGVDGSTRLALKLVVADYRLKRIALGHDASPVPEVVNYLDLQARRLQNISGPQRQHRWWFVARYDAVRHSPDETAFEFEGSGVAVLTAPTHPGAKAGSGNKTTSGQVKTGDKGPQASPAAQQFATMATKHFPALAAKVPVFAELQNVISLMAVAELIASRGESSEDERAVPDDEFIPAAGRYLPTHFQDAKTCPVSTVVVPKQVPSLTNYRLVNNQHWLISISGGVEIRPAAVVGSDAKKESSRRDLPEVRQASRARQSETDRWWWD